MKSYQLEIFADYNQILLHDDENKGDTSESWSDKEYKQMASVSDGVIAIATARNMDVPIEVIVCDVKPLVSLN